MSEEKTFYEIKQCMKCGIFTIDWYTEPITIECPNCNNEMVSIGFLFHETLMELASTSL